MRTRYWSSSRLADWIRGETKPQALSLTDWDRWEQEQRAKHPVRHWAAETALDWIQGVVFYVPDRFRDMVYWYNNRFVYRSYALVADPKNIKPGEWASVWERIFYCSFNALVDYVEVEKALENVRWDTEARVRFQAPKSLFRWPYIRGWRSRAAGLDYLHWEAGLDDTCSQQREDAKTVLELYTWWTETRPNRPDPCVVSGWSEWVETKKPLTKQFQDEWQQAECSKIYEKLYALEAEYDREDCDQLARLVQLQWGLR